MNKKMYIVSVTTHFKGRDSVTVFVKVSETEKGAIGQAVCDVIQSDKEYDVISEAKAFPLRKYTLLDLLSELELSPQELDAIDVSK
jgi:hypothetical protein